MAVAANKSSFRPWRGDGRELSPERNPVWTEPRTDKSSNTKAKSVPVVYYLSRNGQLEHPHFMEVTLSSPEGLYLRDVIHRLNLLRGKGMASLYAWSSKRSYKNGFVWHDLTDDDFIYPAHGNEYVLKGSELLLQIDALAPSDTAADAVTTSPVLSSSLSISSGSTSSSSPSVSSSDKDGVAGAGPSRVLRKKPPHHRWGSLDLGEYKVVYKASTTATNAASGECGGGSKVAADAATQTDDVQQSRPRQWRRRDKARSEIPDLEVPPREEGLGKSHAVATTTTTELDREEISPPPSSSSPETLETLIKADVGRARAAAVDVSGPQRDLGLYPSGRARASAVLINLISCGAISVKDHHGAAVSSPQYSCQQQRQHRLPPRGGETDPRAFVAASSFTVGKKEVAECRGFPAVQLEDKEYFSGSLIETKKQGTADGAGEFAALKRSNSYNADRSSKMVMEMAEREMDAVRSKCIPRKPKPAPPAAVAGSNGANNSSRKDAGGAAVTRSAHGSKRISSAGEETSV